MVIFLNGVRYEIADCFENLKTRHYQRIMLEWDQDKKIVDRDFFKLFCILADLDFKSFHSTAENEQSIWNSIRWVIEQDFNFDKEPPSVIKIGDKIITVPQRVELLSIGQNIHLKNEMAGLSCIEGGISIATAIFLQPIYDEGKFDFERAIKLKALIDEMPINLIYPIGFFLLQNALKTGTHSLKNSNQPMISRIAGFVKTLTDFQSRKDYNHSRI